MSIIQIVIKKLVLPNSPFFWGWVSIAVFVGLIATDHLLTALAIFFIILFIVVVFLFFRSLFDPYASENLRAGLGFASFLLLLLVIGFSLLMRGEWNKEEDNIEPMPTQKDTTTEQTLPSSENQTTANQTSP